MDTGRKPIKLPPLEDPEAARRYNDEHRLNLFTLVIELLAVEADGGGG